MPGRARVHPLVHPADFQRLRQAPSWSRSAHFAVHHLPGRPLPTARTLKARAAAELSTGALEQPVETVDDSPPTFWLGCVLPKRLARRAVTRNLLRRQIRSALHRQHGRLPAGLWLVRLRAAFPKAAFPSAASEALRRAAREELETVLGPRAAPAARR